MLRHQDQGRVVATVSLLVTDCNGTYAGTQQCKDVVKGIQLHMGTSEAKCTHKL